MHIGHVTTRATPSFKVPAQITGSNLIVQVMRWIAVCALDIYFQPTVIASCAGNHDMVLDWLIYFESLDKHGGSTKGNIVVVSCLIIFPFYPRWPVHHLSTDVTSTQDRAYRFWDSYPAF